VCSTRPASLRKLPRRAHGELGAPTRRFRSARTEVIAIRPPTLKRTVAASDPDPISPGPGRSRSKAADDLAARPILAAEGRDREDTPTAHDSGGGPAAGVRLSIGNWRAA